MRRYRARLLQLTVASAVTALATAGCSSGGASTTSSGTTPLVVGFTQPLTGDFSADGEASLRGYQLWASDVNSHGGLLGRPVKLTWLDNKSDPKTTASEYTQLITQDHVDFTLAPFSSLLTIPAAQATRAHQYILPAGSAGAPAVYDVNDPYLLSTTTPVETQMVPFADWVAALPPGERPKNAAYPMVSDPFADPPVQRARTILQNAGVQTVYAPRAITGSNLTPYANAVAAKHPDIVVLGSVDVPTVLTFIHVFEHQHYTPKMFIAASGPDQGAEFLNHVGTPNAEAIMVPNGWYGGEQNALSHVMVQDYIAKYGGTTSGINADVAEAYSAGEALAAGITATHSLEQGTINQYLHSHTVQTVTGPARFAPNGRNERGGDLIFQWQGGRFNPVLPTNPPGTPAIERFKPAWQVS
jgi:branched-chain amino acid transport system substrate-binding protein